MKSITMYMYKTRFKPIIGLLFLLCFFDLKSQSFSTVHSAFYNCDFYRTPQGQQNTQIPVSDYPTITTTDFIGTSEGTALTLTNDGTLDIPLLDFSFKFFCANVTSLRVGTDGALLVNTPAGSVPSSNPSLITATNTIAPWWDSWDLGTGQVRYIRKSNPDRLIVQWSDISPFSSTLTTTALKATFRVVIYAEGNTDARYKSTIAFYYQDVEFKSEGGNPNSPLGIFADESEYAKKGVIGIKGECSSGRRGDGVNATVKNVPDPPLISLVVNELIRAIIFKPNACVLPTAPALIAKCQGDAPFTMPNGNTQATNGEWKNSVTPPNGLPFLSDNLDLASTFNPTTPGLYQLRWDPGCTLYGFNVDIRVDDKLNILTPVQDLTGCNKTQFTVTGETPSVLTAGNPVWTKLSGTTTAPAFPTTANPITVQGVLGTVNLALTNGTCVTNVALTNNPITPGGAEINLSHCGGSVNVVLTESGATDFSWSFVNPPPAGVSFNPNPPVTNTATVTGLAANAGAVEVSVTYKVGTACKEQLFRLTGGAGGEASVNGNTASTQTVSQCNNGTFTLTADNPTAPSVGKWEFVGVPPVGVTMNPSVSPNNPVTVLGVPTGVDVLVRWVIGMPSGAGLTCTDTVVVTLKNFAPVTAQLISTNTTNCGDGTFTLSAVNPSPYTGFWRKKSGAGTISNASNFLTSISGVTGTTVVEWVVYSTLQFGPPCRDSAQLTLINKQKPVPTLGIFDRDVCNAVNNTINIEGITPATPVGTQGEWHYSDGVLLSTNDITGVMVPVGTSITVRFVVSDGMCSDSIAVTLRNFGTVTAVAPSVAPQCNNATFNISATPAATGSWSKVSGPGAITPPFTNASTTVTGVTAGSTTVVRWTVTGGACPNSSADVTLINNAPSSVSLGEDIARCESQGLTVSLTGTAVGTGIWSVVPAGALTFAPNNNPNSTATVAMAFINQDVTATYCATNANCPQACDAIKVRIDKNVTASIVSVVPATSQCENGNFTLTGNTPSVFTAKTWSKVSAANNVTLPANLTTETIAVSNLPIGQSVTMAWTITNGACASSSQVTLRNVAKPSVTLRAMDCMSPVNLDALITSLVGNGTWSALGANPGTFSGSTHSVSNGTTNFTTYTPSTMELACGEVKLQISVTNPGCPDVVTQSVTIKLGTSIVEIGRAHV